MEKEEVINCLNYAVTPDQFELEIIKNLMTYREIHTILVNVFNFGKQQGIRQERKKKAK